MKKIVGLIGIASLLAACSPRGPLALFQKLSPHEQYAERLKSAGLDKTALGGNWLSRSEQVYSQALEISLPYKEAGYFAAEKIEATVLRFTAKRGQQLNFNISVRPTGSFVLYADLALTDEGGSRKIVASADSSGRSFSYEVKKTGTYLLRLQPELLKGGEYTLNIGTGPSLKFPVAISGRPNIGSFWGDSRDNGGRSHEGIDIFAPKGTPALAAKSGTVTRVTDNNLGGKVVFMRPDEEDYNLYYAHLMVQLVHDGQRVAAGDTVGLIDNTGNAKNTPTHLHFGIYASEGAVDPLPFVDRKVTSAPELGLPLSRLNDTLRLLRSVDGLGNGEPVRVIGINAGRYKVMDNQGKSHWLTGSSLAALSALRMRRITTDTALFDQPALPAARKQVLKSGARVAVLAENSEFELVRYGDGTGWLKK